MFEGCPGYLKQYHQHEYCREATGIARHAFARPVSEAVPHFPPRFGEDAVFNTFRQKQSVDNGCS
jgi:hypothetical protein